MTDVPKQAFAVVVEDVVGIFLKIGDKKVEPAIVIVVSQRDAHGCHGIAETIQPHPRIHPDFGELPVVFVVEEVCGKSVIGDEQVRRAVVIVIGSAHGKVLALLGDSRGGRYIRKRSVAVVVVENIRGALVSNRRTTRAYSGEIAVAGAGIQIDVPPDIEIQSAIAIVVKECGAAMKEVARFRTGHSRLVGDVGEGSVPLIAVKNVAA